jgi:hypothetical protein
MKDKIAKDKNEWWSLVRQDLSKWNSKNHSEDWMSIGDWIGEVGPKIHGWVAFRDPYGDWDVSLTGYSDDDDDDDDDDNDEE